MPHQRRGLQVRVHAGPRRFEIFEYRREGPKADVRFPQDGRESHLEYTITACDELRPFDLCLDLADNPWGGPKRYYGLRDQESSDAMQALDRSLRAATERAATTE